MLIPGGFGTRGIEGMILAVGHARENKIPLFGNLPGNANDGCRMGQECLRAYGSQQF